MSYELGDILITTVCLLVGWLVVVRSFVTLVVISGKLKSKFYEIEILSNRVICKISSPNMAVWQK